MLAHEQDCISQYEWVCYLTEDRCTYQIGHHHHPDHPPAHDSQSQQLPWKLGWSHFQEGEAALLSRAAVACVYAELLSRETWPCATQDGMNQGAKPGTMCHSPISFNDPQSGETHLCLFVVVRTSLLLPAPDCIKSCTLESVCRQLPF